MKNIESVFIVGINGRVAQRHIKAWKELGLHVSGCGSNVNFIDIVSKYTYDVIDICTPIYLHSQMIKEALPYSKTLICEKPLAINEREALEMTKLKGNIGIIYQFRFNPKILKLKKELEEGKYGEIKMVSANYYRWRGEEYYQKWEADKMKAGGGVLFNVCIHYVDLFQWLFGYPTSVKGFITTSKHGLDIEDNVAGIFKFPNGAIGSINLSTHVNPPKHFEMIICGTKGHTTIQLRQNEYHKENFEAILSGKNFVTPIEAFKSLKLCHDIYNNSHLPG